MTRLLGGAVGVQASHSSAAIADRNSTPSQLAIQTLLTSALPARAIWSHRAAGYLHGLDGIEEFIPEISVPRGYRPLGRAIHQRKAFGRLPVCLVHGTPTTSVEQTLGDLGAVVDVNVVERAVESALRSGQVDEISLRRFLYDDSRQGRRGLGTLRTVLDGRRPNEPATGSDAETRFLQILREAGIEEPRRQVEIRVDGIVIARLDFAWWRQRVAAEVDGFETHGSPAALQSDLGRQNLVLAAGWDLRRFTWLDVVRRPTYVARTMQQALGLWAP